MSAARNITVPDAPERSRTVGRPGRSVWDAAATGSGVGRLRHRVLARNPPGREHGAVQIVAGQITIAELSAMAEATFGDLVKAVVDVRRGLLAVDAGMHSDLEALLLDAGAGQADLWGINLYPAEHGTSGFLEFDSMINLRPGQGNRTRSVENPEIRVAIAELVGRMVVP